MKDFTKWRKQLDAHLTMPFNFHFEPAPLVENEEDTDARSCSASDPGSSGQVTFSDGLESQPTPQSTYENPDGFAQGTDVWLGF